MQFLPWQKRQEVMIVQLKICILRTYFHLQLLLNSCHLRTEMIIICAAIYDIIHDIIYDIIELDMMSHMIIYDIIQ